MRLKNHIKIEYEEAKKAKRKGYSGELIIRTRKDDN